MNSSTDNSSTCRVACSARSNSALSLQRCVSLLPAPAIGFTIAGADKKFVPAKAAILPDGRIEVSSEAVAEPVAVRYAWADNPVCNMYSAAGLPLTPFRTDDFPGVTVSAK